jgi:hypothetical protein
MIKCRRRTHLVLLQPETGKFSSMARGLGFSAGNGIYEEPPTSQDKGCSCFGFQPNKLVIQYLNWAFRSSFVVVFFSAAVAFFSLTVGFAVLIYASGMNKPNCVYVNGVDFGTTDANFMDAYALSWTTFSTVVCTNLELSCCRIRYSRYSQKNVSHLSHCNHIYAAGLRINLPGNIIDQ